MSETEGLQIRWVDVAVQAVTIQPGDILIVHYPALMSHSMVERLIQHIRTSCPQLASHQILVLQEGMSLGVLRPEEA